MKLRPCIDLHNGIVKQIVGSTLSDDSPGELTTNFVADRPASWFAEMYRRDNLTGGHVIMLGPGNEEAAASALAAFPGGLQIGGGINTANAASWIERGAGAVIVTSYVFKNGLVHEDRLRELRDAVGADRLVLDLSCRKRAGKYYIVTDRWQKFTDVEISPETLDYFAGFCHEFLVHAADVEGKCAGIAEDLAEDLGKWSPAPTTYAGGVRNRADMELIYELGNGRLDVTVGSSLDIFGGTGITYEDALAMHNSWQVSDASTDSSSDGSLS